MTAVWTVIPKVNLLIIFPISDCIADTPNKWIEKRCVIIYGDVFCEEKFI